MRANDFFDRLDEFGRNRTPCLFLIDFEEKKPLAVPLSEVDPDNLLFSFPQSTNCPRTKGRTKLPAEPVVLRSSPLSFELYRQAFEEVRLELEKGNSYLVNLTSGTPVETPATLCEIFHASRALYRIWLRDSFVFFSPEQFVGIKDNVISTFPMKGTVDASVPDAGARLLVDEKEKAEHVTVVDLLRNDLSIIARNVRVSRFRFLTSVVTPTRRLIHSSSEIRGDLSPGWQASLGRILKQLLPAGSVSGAPKKKTLEIIRRVEKQERGYYTGIAGIFDGDSLDTAVMIRFIEQKPDASLVYWSGGGITIYSDAELEYREMKDKIYVPID